LTINTIWYAVTVAITIYSIWHAVTIPITERAIFVPAAAFVDPAAIAFGPAVRLVIIASAFTFPVSACPDVAIVPPIPIARCPQISSTCRRYGFVAHGRRWNIDEDFHGRLGGWCECCKS
jgi:hypothetical protein